MVGREAAWGQLLTARLSCSAKSDRGRAGHHAIRQELHRRAPPSLPRPPRQRPLPLGARRRATRSQKPRQIRRTAQKRLYSRTRPSIRRRPEPICRLRDAPCRHDLRPRYRTSKNHLINGGESPCLAVQDLSGAVLRKTWKPPLRLSFRSTAAGQRPLSGRSWRRWRSSSFGIRDIGADDRGGARFADARDVSLLSGYRLNCQRRELVGIEATT